MMQCVEAEIECPYCGESLRILLDPSIAQQEYIEDCQVCCRPIQIELAFDEDVPIYLHCRREDD